MDPNQKQRSATPVPIIVTYSERRFEIPIPVQTRTLVDKGTPARWAATAPDDLQKAGHATVDAIMANMATSIAMREGP